MTLTPNEYAFWPNEEKPEYGLLFCLDDDGNRVTLRGDPELVRMCVTRPLARWSALR